MSKILLTCRKCGHEAANDIGEWALDGLCADCYLRGNINPYRSDLQRLLLKRERYLNTGISVVAIDQQLSSLIRRIEKKMLNAMPAAAPKVRKVLYETVADLEAEAKADEILRAVPLLMRPPQ
jgi:hypothetical protein